ncbi:MAG: type I-G CRISPR-associated helicase/endonuclease Cas3g [Trebonia sp.]
MQNFEDFFEQATGYKPHGYQARIADDGLPDVLKAPTGTGKTGVILAWLWRRLYGPVPAGTPRRLIYALPQRSLVDQVSAEARKWLMNLGLTEEVALHVVMGGRGETQGDWRENMHQPAVVVGTVDSLVSKALVRAYGVGRAMYPIDFALATNGAHWVIDEIQLCPESTTTLRQLAGFAAKFGTAEPFGLTCMSATVPDGLLETVDNRSTGSAVEILPEERHGELAVRLGAVRAIRRMSADPGDYKALAATVRELHRPGTLTLVVANTVSAARDVYKQLRGGPAACTLLHSRFRGIERAGRMAEVVTRPEDRIVVSTQVVEAGIDLSAAVLVTEAAPWPSLVQRVGRCNRTGKITDAEVWWLPPAKPLPYEREDIDATATELDQLEGAAVTGEDLLGRHVVSTQDQVAVIRRSDFLSLFDTSPDLAGNDVDIAPYVRDAEDLDAEVAWATWTAGEAGAPDPEVRSPAAEYRCRVSLGDAVKLAKDRAVWRFDQVAGRWTRVTGQLQSRPRPGEVLLVNAADGGYDPETGFDPSARGPVPDSPRLLTPQESAQDGLADVVAGVEDAYAADTASVAPRTWQSLGEHSEQVRDQAAALVKVLAPGVPAEVGRSAVIAGYLHDVGKAHPIWQDALCGLAGDDERSQVASGRPWAKSGGKGGALHFAGGVSFRHELASVLLADGPLRGLLADAPDPALSMYLMLAHHGKLRIQVRDPGDLAVLPDGEASTQKILGLEQGVQSQIPSILGQPATTLTVDLDQFQLGGDRSWTRTVLGLRDKYGPFVLAYLETLVRVADWRASGGRELPE